MAFIETVTEIDKLTGCLTRKSMDSYFNRLKLESSVLKYPFSILFIDMDKFKVMNDKYGHFFGDDMLKYFCSSIRFSLEKDYFSTQINNFVFRYGGDEFVVMLPSKDSHTAYKTARYLLSIIKERKFISKGKQFKLSFSCGIVSFPQDGSNLEELLKKADQALYFSKKNKRGSATEFCRINILKIKHWILLVLVAIGITLSVLIVYLSFGGSKFKTFYFVNNEGKPQPSVRTIYLKSGGTLKGAVIEYEDIIFVSFIMDRGTGQIVLKKAEIEKIVPPMN